MKNDNIKTLRENYNKIVGKRLISKTFGKLITESRRNKPI